MDHGPLDVVDARPYHASHVLTKSALSRRVDSEV